MNISAERNVVAKTVTVKSYGAPRCFSEGTVPGLSTIKCVCRNGWNGVECSIPDAVWTTREFQVWYSSGRITRRSRPRAIVNGLVFNHELDLLEIRINELGNAVDHYIVCESNYTFFGTAKPLHLRSNLSAGFLRENAHKIILVTVGVYNYGDGDPWAPENHFRRSIWLEGQRSLKHLRDDDLFMIADADEIPSREVLLFLKHHDGYGEPVGVSLRWFMYGFFWENSRPVEVGGACTVAFLRNVYENDTLKLRRTDSYVYKSLPHTGTTQRKWTIMGAWPRYAGWHCSWCFDVHGIQMKLAAAQRDDGIRWGDIAQKGDPAYISGLRKSGRYFDDSGPLETCDAHEAAPAYVRKNAGRFSYLMVA
ncbi:beta-1,4-mannosyl-glycoprotein 4-beta-N-acetylglucosaminyltransferase [Rhipicephalus sanguineus]|uniref:beta-1,4-mannosyl-glycoprotein 4-beta-N-acetylglucosaminyltransferase n=1 Tax=Rhipicephalus sanguineus TaxID=34632 RepID=UPI0020C216A1|nr:beta-1,4-mannosyl-glycoprotein 4-beta-N-acetylglucosaminyltransferase [Rhipicephalus sanguineus]